MSCSPFETRPRRRLAADASFPTPPVAWSLELPGRGAFNVNNSNLNAAISSAVRFGSLVAVALVSGSTPSSAQVFAINVSSSNASGAWASQIVQVAGPDGCGSLVLTLSADGTVVLLSIGAGNSVPSVSPGALFAFTFSTGALLWSRTEISPQQLYSLSSSGSGGLPAAHAGGFLVYGLNTSSSAYVLAKLSAATGGVAWTSQLLNPERANLDQSLTRLVCVKSSGPGPFISAVDTATGLVLWTTAFPFPALSYYDVVFNASALSILAYYSGSTANLAFMSIALANGSLSTSATTIPAPGGNFGVSLVAFGGAGLFIAGANNTAYLINVPANANATTLWSYVAPDGSDLGGAVVVANGSMPYVIIGSDFFFQGSPPPSNVTARLWVVDANGATERSVPGPSGAAFVGYRGAAGLTGLNGAAAIVNASNASAFRQGVA